MFGPVVYVLFVTWVSSFLTLRALPSVWLAVPGKDESSPGVCMCVCACSLAPLDCWCVIYCCCSFFCWCCQVPALEEINLSVGRSSDLACATLAVLGLLSQEYVRGMRQVPVRSTALFD